MHGRFDGASRRRKDSWKGVLVGSKPCVNVILDFLWTDGFGKACGEFPIGSQWEVDSVDRWVAALALSLGWPT